MIKELSPRYSILICHRFYRGRERRKRPQCQGNVNAEDQKGKENIK